MLAKKIKIENIKKQREFIENNLKRISDLNEDGDTSYPYVGYLFPEVKKYFESEGYKIVEVTSNFIQPLAKGRPLHLFTIKDDIVLSEEELEEAEKVETPNEKFTRIVKESLEDPFEDLENIFGSDEDKYSGTFNIISALGRKFGERISKSEDVDENNESESETSEEIDDGYKDEP